MSDVRFLDTLSPTQEHFLKKFLVEACLAEELLVLSEPRCLEYLGPPFRPPSDQQSPHNLPLLRYFFNHFVATFPFVAMNPKNKQVEFWRDTVQPFVESFNNKKISGSVQRKENVTKRSQVSTRVLRLMLLFFNSMLGSKKELDYLTGDHLKPSDQGKLDKISKAPTQVIVGLDSFQCPSSLDDYLRMNFINNYNINIIAVDTMSREAALSWNLNPLHYLSSQKQTYNLFIIQVTRRSRKGGLYMYESHFVSRSYSEFKALELSLKTTFSRLMITKLPLKFKNDLGVLPLKESFPITGASETPPIHEAHHLESFTRQNASKYHKEKLRLALRGFINSLLSKPEIANSKPFDLFINDPAKIYHDLTPDQLADYQQRALLENYRLETQEEFQEHISGVVLELAKNFEHFKEELITDPKKLSQVFEEFSESKLLDDIPALLVSFMEWCKLEVAATLYQIFLTQDNSAEWLQKCRKFHRLFPYRMCYGILKYTNPMKIMSRIVDLLLLDVPSFSRKKNESNNLLSMTFVMLLDEDLGDFSKERAKLLGHASMRQPDCAAFIKRINFYVNTADQNLQAELREENLLGNMNLLLTILSSDRLLPKLSESELRFYKEEILPSYEAYTKLNDRVPTEKASVYLLLEQLLQLEVRSRDKENLKKLWKEPELTQLIKKFLTVFYQPLMSVMKKCNVHLVFSDWQHFLDDLFAELTNLDEGEMYFLSTPEIFDRFKSLLDKHEKTLWKFLHDLYTKDDQQLFMKLIAWIESFLVAIRTKFITPERVNLDFSVMQASEPIDQEKFVKDLNKRITFILKKRLLLKQCITNAALHKNDEKDSHKKTKKVTTHQQAIDMQWDQINNQVFDMKPQEFGISAEDFEEFNLANINEAAAFGGDHKNAQIFREIAELDKAMKVHAVSEVDKLIAPTHAQIKTVLEGLAGTTCETAG